MVPFFSLSIQKKKRHDFLSGLYGTSTVVGILLASAGVSLLNFFQITEQGWRILYVFGCVTALFGCKLRSTLPTSRSSSSVTFRQSLILFRQSLYQHKKAAVLLALISGFSYANYSIALILVNGFIPLVTSFNKEMMMSLNTGLLVLDFCTLPLFGWLAEKTSREKVMLASALCILVTSVPLFLFLEHSSFAVVVALRIYLVLVGVAFSAPFHAWTQHLIPAPHRYSIIAFSYAIGSQLLGGPTVAFSLWLFKTTQQPSSIAWYWMLLAMTTSIGLARSLKARTRSEELRTVNKNT